MSNEHYNTINYHDQPKMVWQIPANTQTVEPSWRSLKKAQKNGMKSDDLKDNFGDYLNRREVSIY